MIRQLKNIPNTMVGFVAYGEVTTDHFNDTVIPAVSELVQRTNELNYLLVLHTDLKNFTLGAWWKDALLGIENITKWNRVAIVTDREGIQVFTELFSKIMPGEFRGFDEAELSDAISWVSGSSELREDAALYEEIKYPSSI